MDAVTFEKELLVVRPKLYNYACQLTMCVEDAEDLLQETCLKIWTNAEKFITEQNFKGWAFTIMKNIFINDYRKNAKRKQINDSTPNDYFLNLTNVYAQETPDGTLSEKEIRNIVNKFNEELRTPFKYYLAGYEYKEIAETMGIPLGTVKSRIFFARKKLQKMLKDFR